MALIACWMLFDSCGCGCNDYKSEQLVLIDEGARTRLSEPCLAFFNPPWSKKLPVMLHGETEKCFPRTMKKQSFYDIKKKELSMSGVPKHGAGNSKPRDKWFETGREARQNQE